MRPVVAMCCFCEKVRDDTGLSRAGACGRISHSIWASTCSGRMK